MRKISVLGQGVEMEHTASLLHDDVVDGQYRPYSSASDAQARSAGSAVAATTRPAAATAAERDRRQAACAPLAFCRAA